MRGNSAFSMLHASASIASAPACMHAGPGVQRWEVGALTSRIFCLMRNQSMGPALDPSPSPSYECNRNALNSFIDPSISISQNTSPITAT
ncbi:hypothetical protein IE81DRAFT_247504 [Ceraceosorus guamensis]|uniref:Uncharacterized protein n=1 Tax=Ceraceosorus guamensis TaxID=1522189 RepID=A0A316VS02_9BASI|nr:hypothetical protein IE81DRAFT_247504 [Ceraceosorus guamensis]PWN39994.1 hypothetical protein IE81DRAFT_247504 [Ceraceosorus guamensis]